MKTIEEILAQPNIAEIVKDLSYKVKKVPAWGELVKAYDPTKHPVMTEKEFMPSNGVAKTRVTLGWQKLAVKRMAELAFGIPVKRVYNAENDEQQKAVKVLEAIYKKNRIDAENINRARKLYAACEFATIWYTQEQETTYGGEKTDVKLRCKTYSPMDGDTIYPLFDDYDDLVALSVKYARTMGNTTQEYFETYTATEHYRWAQIKGAWTEELHEQMTIGKIAGVYAHRSEPIWENESEGVYEAERTLSRNGNYIRKNSAPAWVVYANKEDLVQFGKSKDEDGAARKVLHYPANCKAGYETWAQSVESIKFHIEQLRQNYFTQLQLPNMSFDEMKTTPMSGESRKMMFIDAQLKVMDETGLWYEALSREFNVIKAFAKIMFPNLAPVFDELEVEHIITPYMIKDLADKVNTYVAACQKPVMSQRTAIEQLGEVDDVEQEIQRINEEDATILEEVTY